MGKGVVLTSGIFERYIPEFHFILPIPALFHRQTALVHPVGNVQEAELQFQKRGVVPHIPQVGYQLGYALRHLGNGGHILGHCAQAESPGPGLQADEAVGNPGKHDGNGTGGGTVKAHGSPGIPGEDSLGMEGILFILIVLLADFLLLIGAYIGSQLSAEAHIAKVAEQPVPQPVQIRIFGPIAFRLIGKNGGNEGNSQHHRHHQQHHPGAVQPGILHRFCRNRGKEQGQGKGNASQNPQQGGGSFRKILQHPVKAPAAGIFILTDGIQQICILRFVQVHIIRFQNFPGQDILHFKPASCPLGFLPLFQQCGNQGNPGGGAQGQQHPEAQLPVVPSSRQFLNHPGGKIDSHVGGQGRPDPLEGFGQNHLRMAAENIEKAPAVQPKSFLPGFCIMLLHVPLPLPDNICSVPHRAWHISPLPPKGSGGFPPRKCCPHPKG